VNEPRFLPLVCPECSADLVGRAEDRAAYCRPCGLAFRCDQGRIEAIPVARVTALPGGDGPLIYLPFWLDGPSVMPAFHSSRPLTLARIAARLLGAWRAEKTLSEPPPLGARLDPARLGEVARLAKIDLPSPRAPLALLAVPARNEASRFRLPAFDGFLYDEDVTEREALLQEILQLR